MKPRTLRLGVVLALALAGAVGIDAAVDSPRTLMSRDDYRRDGLVIESQIRGEMEGCHAMRGATRELCRAQVRADERVRKADLAALYYGTVDSARQARLARVSAAHDIARAKCAARFAGAGNDCLRIAREQSVLATAQARLTSP